MNKYKISFIICSNDDAYLQECRQYIQELEVPNGYFVEVIPIIGAASMTSGYQQGMCSSDAKYKIYLHQDVFILHRHFIPDILKIFHSNEKIGMLGMVGTKRLPENGCMWTTPMRVGALRSCVLKTVDDTFDLPVSAARGYAPVQAVDGLLIATQYDLPWREDLDLGWDFYDVSQSLEFLQKGYRIAVPYQESPWVLHDNGFLHLDGYHQSRKNFLSAYFPERIEEIIGCDQKNRQAADRRKALAAVQEIKARVLSCFINKEYEHAILLLQNHMKQYQEDEEYCILCIIAGILEQELTAGVEPNILDSLLPQTRETQEAQTVQAPPIIQTDMPSGKPDDLMAWSLKQYRQIRFCLWRLRYLSSGTARQKAEQLLDGYSLSDTALTRFRELAYSAGKRKN